MFLSYKILRLGLDIFHHYYIMVSVTGGSV